MKRTKSQLLLEPRDLLFGMFKRHCLEPATPSAMVHPPKETGSLHLLRALVCPESDSPILKYSLFLESDSDSPRGYVQYHSRGQTRHDGLHIQLSESTLITHVG